MPIYNLIKYSDNYSKAFGIVWQYCRNKPALAANCNAAGFHEATFSFRIKEKRTGETGNYSTNNFVIMVSLKYLSNFWRTLEMLLINCEINLDLKWSKK